MSEPQDEQVLLKKGGPEEVTAETEMKSPTKRTPSKRKANEAFQKESEELLKNFGLSVDMEDGGRRRTRSSVRGVTATPPSTPPTKKSRGPVTATPTSSKRGRGKKAVEEEVDEEHNHEQQQEAEEEEETTKATTPKKRSRQPTADQKDVVVEDDQDATDAGGDVAAGSAKDDDQKMEVDAVDGANKSVDDEGAQVEGQKLTEKKSPEKKSPEKKSPEKKSPEKKSPEKKVVEKKPEAEVAVVAASNADEKMDVVVETAKTTVTLNSTEAAEVKEEKKPPAQTEVDGGLGSKPVVAEAVKEPAKEEPPVASTPTTTSAANTAAEVATPEVVVNVGTTKPADDAPPAAPISNNDSVKLDDSFKSVVAEVHVPEPAAKKPTEEQQPPAAKTLTPAVEPVKNISSTTTPVANNVDVNKVEASAEPKIVPTESPAAEPTAAAQ